MHTTHPLEQKLIAAWPPPEWHDVGVVLAVSGGADSVALVRAMAALKSHGVGRLTVAHFNHRLRGADSDADQAFVRQLSRQLGLDCEVAGHESSPTASRGDGLEAAARADRYAFLQQTAEARGARFVATAHTADDQVETVLHHVLRGTGLSGLAGMSRTRRLGPAVTLIRPLLALRRSEVLQYLASLGQPFREDSTNRDWQFTRNRIRHELVPLLARDYSPAVVESLLRLSALAGDAQRVIDAAAEGLLERAVVESSRARVLLDCRELAGHDRHVVREAFVALWRRRAWPQQDMGYPEWDRLAKMALGEPAATDVQAACKHVFPGAITAQKQGEQLSLLAPPGTTPLKNVSPPRQA